MTDKQSKALQELAATIRKEGARIEAIGTLVETQKWGQASFLPERPRVGTTVRIGPHGEDGVALYVHCQTTLVESWRTAFPELTYEKNRAVVFPVNKPLPKRTIAQLTNGALLYHWNKRHPSH